MTDKTKKWWNKLKTWFAKAIIRAIKTFFETMGAGIVSNAVGILDVEWIPLLSVSALAGLASLIVSVAGMPELESEDANNE